MIKPYQKAIADGKPMEAVGLGATAVAALVLAGELKAGKIAQEGGEASKVANAAKVAYHEARRAKFIYTTEGRTVKQLTQDIKPALRTGESEAQMQQRVQKAQVELDKQTRLPEGNKVNPGDRSITKEQWKTQSQLTRTGSPKDKYVKWLKAYGKEVGSYDAVTPGPLANSIASTFSGGKYSVIKSEKNISLYRVWSKGTSRELGGFWSLEKPSGSLQARIDYALLPEWAEVKGTSLRAVQATNWVKINVPKGSTMYIGEVGNQGGVWMRGKSQVLLEERAIEDWIQQRGTLK